MESITLEQQKREKVPRISGEEALILLGLAKTRITGKPIQVVSLNVPDDGASAECTSKLGRMSKSRMIILDVRSSTEFKRGALPDSINIPFNKAFSASQIVDTEKGQEYGENLAGEMENRLLQLSQDVVENLNHSNRGSKIICVVCSSKNKFSNNYKTDEAQQFAAGLLRMNYNRVCTLHNGIEAFRALAGAGEDVLVVPNV